MYWFYYLLNFFFVIIVYVDYDFGKFFYYNKVCSFIFNYNFIVFYYFFFVKKINR